MTKPGWTSALTVSERPNAMRTLLLVLLVALPSCQPAPPVPTGSESFAAPVPLAGERAAVWPTVQKSPARMIWWNNAAMIEELHLTREQRSQADQVLAAHLASDASVETQAAATAATAALSDALAAGDSVKAFAVAQELSALRDLPFERQLRLKLAVLSLLDEEQRAAIALEYPHILDRPWTLSRRVGNPRAGGIVLQASQEATEDPGP